LEDYLERKINQWTCFANAKQEAQVKKIYNKKRN
jgi:hypothetical protein